MERLKLTKVVASSLAIASALALNPMGASAQWKQNSNGWWNSEVSSWSVGWKDIDGEWYYFDSNGYMKTGWLQYNSKWYYLYANGAMAKNTNIDGYVLDSDGAWIQTTQNSSEKSTSTQNSLSSLSNVNQNATNISGVTGIKSADITKMVFYDGRGGLNKPVTVEDKQKVKEFMGYLDGYNIKKTQNPETTGWAQGAIFYINDKQVINIIFGDPIIINDDYYKIVKGGLDTNKIDEFLKSINPSHRTS